VQRLEDNGVEIAAKPHPRIRERNLVGLLPDGARARRIGVYDQVEHAIERLALGVIGAGARGQLVQDDAQGIHV
jgi:hypothetical protein